MFNKMTSTVSTDLSSEVKMKEAYNKLNEEEVCLPVNSHNSVITLGKHWN